MSVTATTVTVRRRDEGDPFGLHHHYQGELQPQPCFVALDLEDGVLWADWDGEVGSARAVPESMWHRRTLRGAIPCLTAKAANALLEELAPLAERVPAGADIDWDGSHFVGHLTADASDAAERIGERCAEHNFWRGGDTIEEWAAVDWVAGHEDELGITADTTDEQLAAKAAELQAEANEATDEPTILDGTLTYLERLREEARDGR